jgi:cbb3-type cytochrome oxidase subunit 1
LSQPEPEGASLVDAGLVRAHGLASLITLLIAATFGIVVSIQLLVPDFGKDIAWLSWGRLRYAHTQGIMFGWLGNAFFAFLYHAVPILTGRPVTSARLGHWLLVLAGVSQPLEWAEFPLVVDGVIGLGFLLAVLQFLPGFFARGLESLYVSSWYVLGGLVFTLLAYPMGNVVPELVAGAAGAAFSGLWIHDAVGLYVTPLALAIIYFVIPAATRQPIYSHFLSMLGFWLLFFLYPLNGTHHYVFSVIPMAAQTSAIAASALLGVTVVIVVTNLFLSLRGAGDAMRDPALRFVATGTFFYLVVSLQGASQAQMAMNQTVHFTDWVVGHSHLAMLGFASFAAAGGLVHAWQRIPAARYNARAIAAAFWLLTIGLVIMVSDLTIAGVIQGRLWQTDAPWIVSVEASRPFWLVRTLSGIPLGAGFIALLLGLTTGPRGAGLESIAQSGGARPVSHIQPGPAVAMVTTSEGV